jgi:hypothetical protein
MATATATPTQTSFQQSYSLGSPGAYIPGGTGNTIPAPTTSSPVPTSQITNGGSLNLPQSQPAANPSGFMASLGTLKTATPTASPTAAVDAATASLPGGYQKINGAQYNTTALQQGAFDKIQVFGPDGKPLPAGLPANQRPAGSYLAGIPKTTSGSPSGAAPTGSTPSQPQDLSVTGDYSQDPAVIAAQKSYDQSQADLTGAMNAEPSMVDLQNQADLKYNTAGQLADLQKTQKQIDQLNALYTTNVAQGVQQGTPAEFYSASSMAQQLQASQLGIQAARQQGNYQMAQQLVNQTVQLQFQDAQNKINNKLQLLQINENNLNASEKLAASKMAAQAQQDQIKLDAQKSAMNLMLQYPTAGITTNDSLVQAAQKAAAFLAKNPYAGQKPIETGSHTDANGNTIKDYAFQNPDGSLAYTYNPSGTQGNINLGMKIGDTFGMPTYNVGANNSGINIPVRDSNPGAILATSTSVKLPGVIGVDSSPNGNKYLIFDNPQNGINAIKTVLTTYQSYQGNIKAGAAIKIYNGNGSYSASDIGLDPNKSLQEQLKDPNVLQSVAQAIAQHEGYVQSSSNDTTLGFKNPAIVNFWAEASASGVNMNSLIPSLGMGQAAVAAKESILAKMAQNAITLGIDGSQFAATLTDSKAKQAAYKTLQTQGSQLQVSENKTLADFNLLKQAGAKMDANSWQVAMPALNAFLRTGQIAMTGNADVNNYLGLLTTTLTNYAKVVNSQYGASGVTVSANDEIQKLIGRGLSTSAVNSYIDNVATPEMHNTITSYNDALKGLFGNIDQIQTSQGGLGGTTTNTSSILPQTQAAMDKYRSTAPIGGHIYGTDGSVWEMKINPSTGLRDWLQIK